jgi:alpha-1,3-mannosyltransferase
VERNHQAIRKRCVDSSLIYNWRGVFDSYMKLYQEVLGTTERALLQVPIKAVTRQQAVALLDQIVKSADPRIIAFANAHTLNVASADQKFRAVLQRSIVFNDGVGVDLASWILYGASFSDNLNGTDFVPQYLQQTEHGLRVFLLGGRPGVAEVASRRLSELCPRHQFVGSHHGYSENVTPILELIRASRANVILVAMGNPKQELWLSDHLSATGCSLGIGVGALFDFCSGNTPRAPQWLRSARLEWLHRLAQDPKRLAGRYILGNVVFLARVLRQWLSGSRISG